MPWPSKALMVHPQYFTVEYAINPHMLDASGNLNQVDHSKALTQWQILKDTFESTGTPVEVLDGQAGFPDMVFCANQTFPFLKNGQLHLVLSHMQSEKRQGEVPYFRQWAEQNQVTVVELNQQPFEGMGDALWNYQAGEVLAGYGFRTSPEVYSELENIIEQKIITFELKDPRFYHLDTCLAILNGETAAFVEEAFTSEGVATLKSRFSKLIQVPIDEAETFLAGNMCTANGQDVIIQKGANQTCSLLNQHGFSVHEVETSEFIKSGGSVFCMKQLLF